MIDFTTATYQRLLAHIQGLGTPVGPFRDCPASGPYVILRHDVDFSLGRALDMARLDRKAGVSATFFVLLTAPYYAPLSHPGVEQLKEIAALGHEIGLHYDCTGFEALSEAERRRRIDALAEALGAHAGVSVETIAQHKPASASIKLELQGYVDAYSAPFFSEMPYISDSRRHFRVDDVFGFFEQNRRAQAAFHPIWWTPHAASRAEVFAALAREVCGSAAAALADEEARVEAGLRRIRGE